MKGRTAWETLVYVDGGWVFKMVLKQMLFEEVDRIQVGQNRARVGTVITMSVPRRRGISR